MLKIGKKMLVVVPKTQQLQALTSGEIAALQVFKYFKLSSTFNKMFVCSNPSDTSQHSPVQQPSRDKRRKRRP